MLCSARLTLGFPNKLAKPASTRPLEVKMPKPEQEHVGMMMSRVKKVKNKSIKSEQRSIKNGPKPDRKLLNVVRK